MLVPFDFHVVDEMNIWATVENYNITFCNAGMCFLQYSLASDGRDETARAYAYTRIYEKTTLQVSSQGGPIVSSRVRVSKKKIIYLAKAQSKKKKINKVMP